MKTIFTKVQDIIDNKAGCPLPLKIIPNNMGINLCCVDAISWQRQSDGQLVNLTIHFSPEEAEPVVQTDAKNPACPECGHIVGCLAPLCDFKSKVIVPDDHGDKKPGD